MPIFFVVFDLADPTHNYVVLNAFPLGYTAQTKIFGIISARVSVQTESLRTLLEKKTSSAASGEKRIL